MQIPSICDFHCDTLTYLPDNDAQFVDTLNQAHCALSLDTLPKQVNWAQVFAVFIPDTVRGQAAKHFFARWHQDFVRQMNKYSDKISHCLSYQDMISAFDSGKTAAFLAVEGGSVLCGDLTQIKHIYNCGVRFLTLTWNGENEIGSGKETKNGLSPFGIELIPALEQQGILIDISHLNDTGTQQVLDLCTKPPIATHSNARSVTNCARNLTDSFITQIAIKKGLIGLNFCHDFLSENRAESDFDVPYRHVMHLMEYGGAECVTLGSDFDGTDLIPCLSSSRRVLDFGDYLLSRNLSSECVNGILWENGHRFLRENL